jgi:hypothetical protein
MLADLRRPTWRYEFAVFHMFWVWYISNAPRLVNAGATKPLLDAFHRQCYRALREARLIEPGTAALKAWQAEIEKRVLTYRRAYEATNSGPEASLRIYAGTVGYELLRFLDPDKEPSGLAVIVNEIGQMLFIETVKCIERLETRYSNK